MNNNVFKAVVGTVALGVTSGGALAPVFISLAASVASSATINVGAISEAGTAVKAFRVYRKVEKNNTVYFGVKWEKCVYRNY